VSEAYETDHPMIADDGPAEGQLGFPEQPLPTAQSVLWRPAIQELARPDADVSPIFIAQRALAAVEDHLQSAPRQALLGFLVGRVFTRGGGGGVGGGGGDAGQLYVVVHGAVRVPQVIVGGATDGVVAQSIAAAQRVIAPEDGVVVGWYKSDPKGTLELTAQDHAAHVRHFDRSWQVALVMAIGPHGTRGGFFRPSGHPGSPVPYLSFYELLDAETYRDGWKQPRVAWSNYWSPDPAVWRLTRATATPPRGSPVIHSGPRPRLLTPPIDDDDPAWRGPSLVKGVWHWWALAGAAVVGAVLVGVRIGLGPPSPPSAPPPAPAPPPPPAPAPVARAAAPARPVADTALAHQPEAALAEPVRRAIDAYRLRAKLFANHQMTCDDLAHGFADVDEQWLHYTLAAPQTMLGDSTASPQGTLAADVDEVEADFERSGCPRP
jgi:hypothetical protein